MGLASALSRFGTFRGLSGLHSASGQEAYPHTATLNFYKSKYTSKYLKFTPVEQETVSEKPLEKLTSAQTALITKYDAPPGVPASEEGAVPFIDFGGKYFVHGAPSTPRYCPANLGPGGRCARGPRARSRRARTARPT